MIRINLLEAATHPLEEAPSEPMSPAAFQGQVGAGALVLAAVVVFGAHWFFTRRLDRLNQQMEVEKREAARLSAIQAVNNRYSAQLQEVNRRIDVLRVLEGSRRGAGQFMRCLARAASDISDLHLVSVAPQGGRIVLSGAAISEGSIGTLVTSLRAAEGVTDVQLREYYEDDEKTGGISFKFTLDFSYAESTTTKTAESAAPGVQQGAPAQPKLRGT
jgi:Tfp pilus assembly protein PilN